MRPLSATLRSDLVLVGGGHSHVEVFRRFAMRAAPDIRLTLISRDIDTPYTGMLPGFVAGHYTHAECHIDLRPLAQAAGARLFHNEAVGLDLAGKQVLCAGRPPVSFDYLSLDIGSRPGWRGIPGAAEHTLPVKPVDEFLAKWAAVEEAALRSKQPFRIVVVGGGAGGVEICLTLQYRLGKRGNNRAQFAIVTDQPELLPTHGRGTRQRLTRITGARGIALHLNHKVARVTPNTLHCEPGGEIPFDAAVWVTSASAVRWLADTGLKIDARGFILVDDRLQSLSHPFVFAAGDTASIVGRKLAKAGVYAVREGPPLARNLRQACRGEGLERYRPQRRHLALISTGDKNAVASRGGFSAEGAWLWPVKDYIDRRWMRMYQDLEAMGGMSKQPMNGVEPEMRCGGCGAKVGSELLGRVLRRVNPPSRPDVVIGLAEADDAAVVTVSGNQLLVQSVDFFRAFLDDPYLFGRIAANHCLGDLYAMGATPQSALAVVTLPYGPAKMLEADLTQLLTGAVETLTAAGAVLVGGHTGEGAELALGFTVNGTATPDQLLRKGGMRQDDCLILTKPLGTGTLFAADMRGKACGAWIDAALQTMLQSSQSTAGILRRHGATACTDVTGFGLVGHLLEMLRASDVDSELSLPTIPALDGALALLGRGIASSLAPQNAALGSAVDGGAVTNSEPRVALLYDPQTAGGLLASLPAEQSDACLAELRANGAPQAAVIGRVRARAGGELRIRLTA
jgi:selenide,water dikinase